MNRFRFLPVLAAVLILFTVSACGGKGAPVGVFGGVSTEEEIQLGRSAASEVERRNPVSQSRTLQTRANRIGQRLARNSGRKISYHFRVLDIAEPNAFALPGGYIYMNRGIIDLAQSDAEIGGVLAHEIAHVAARHGIEQLQRAQTLGLGLGILDLFLGGKGAGGSLGNLAAQLVAQGVFLHHSRDAEREADRLGVAMMRRTGIHPGAMITFLERLEAIQQRNPSRVETFFSTHPSLEERRHNISDLISEGRTSAGETEPHRCFRPHQPPDAAPSDSADKHLPRFMT